MDVEQIESTADLSVRNIGEINQTEVPLCTTLPRSEHIGNMFFRLFVSVLDFSLLPTRI